MRLEAGNSWRGDFGRFVRGWSVSKQRAASGVAESFINFCDRGGIDDLEHE